MTFRNIPAGCFRMGQQGIDGDEEPVTEVAVPEFWMGETPVTQEQYRVLAEACLGELGAIEGNRGSEPSEFKGRDDSARRPVENVSWFEARVIAWCLAGRMQEQRLLPAGHTVDLPPEAFWECACRARSGTDYWSGDGEAALSDVGWFSGNAGGQTHPVKAKNRPNDWGLHDLHGNVREWCLDLYEATRGRFRLPGELAAAYVDERRLERAPADPTFVAWARLFTRISGGKMSLEAEDFSLMSALGEMAKGIVKDGDESWEPVLEGCKAGLSSGGWPEDQKGVAEQLRVIFQGRVDASGDGAEPDRVLRGGSWNNRARNCRSAYRNRNRPGNRNRNNGFRLCVFPGTEMPHHRTTRLPEPCRQTAGTKPRVRPRLTLIRLAEHGGRGGAGLQP